MISTFRTSDFQISGSAISSHKNIQESKQITQDEYDQWRYHYPVVGQTTHTHFAKVIPQELSDMLIAEGKKINKSESKKK